MSRITAIDHRGSLGGGENMIAINLSGNVVRTGSGGAGGPDSLTGSGKMGGQGEQKMFRLRMSSTCLP